MVGEPTSKNNIALGFSDELLEKTNILIYIIKGFKTMEWLNYFFTLRPLFIASIFGIIVSIFIYAARSAHIKHLDRLKKIDEMYNPKVPIGRRR